MILLDRNLIRIPTSWEVAVSKALPKLALFQQKATEFEALDVDSDQRRAGFRSYAPSVLPGRKGKEDFRSIWGRAKREIAKMSHGKCAYCESPITAERSGQVEHFKPKALFPSLVYVWHNYFLGCGGCNGSKGDKWPKGGLSYVRPDEGDPVAWFTFFDDGRMNALVVGSAAEMTIIDFNMNDAWLCNWRAREVARALEDVRAIFAEAGISDEIKQRLARNAYNRLRRPEIIYSAAIQQCFRRLWENTFPNAAL